MPQNESLERISILYWQIWCFVLLYAYKTMVSSNGIQEQSNVIVLLHISSATVSCFEQFHWISPHLSEEPYSASAMQWDSFFHTSDCRWGFFYMVSSSKSCFCNIDCCNSQWFRTQDIFVEVSVRRMWRFVKKRKDRRGTAICVG